MKINFTVRQEVLDLIDKDAERLKLYDPNFKDDPERQCSGYHAFRTLVLSQHPLAKNTPYKDLHPDLIRCVLSLHMSIRALVVNRAVDIREHLKKKP